MQEEVKHEEIITKVVINKGNNRFVAQVGQLFDDKEVFAIDIRKNTERHFIAYVLDEDGYDFCGINVFNIDAVQIYTKRIAVDGPNEK